MMRQVILRLLHGDHGQDVVEYALLTASIGLMGIAVWPLIVTGIGATYTALDTATQNLWEVPDPGGA
jgi:Flp pilus assembly pilin Flp